MHRIIKSQFNWKLVSRVIRWHYGYYVHGKSAPLIAAFQLTDRCNLKCKMCTIWRNLDIRILPLSDFKSAIDDLSDLGCYYVTLTGGESTTIKNFDEYVKYAGEKIPYVNVVTNGLILDDKRASRLKNAKVDMFCVSIDGFERTHDFIRGVNGSYKRCFRAISNIRKYCPDAAITVNTIIAQENISELIEFSDFIYEQQLKQKFQPIYKHPDFSEMKDVDTTLDLEMTEDDIEEVSRFVKHIRERKNILNSRGYLDRIPGFFEGTNTDDLFDEDCISPSYYCEIRENSRVYSCLEGTDWKGGVDIKGNLKKAMAGASYQQEIRELKSCRKCQKAMPVCYMEPRINFPVKNFLRYGLLPGSSVFNS